MKRGWSGQAPPLRFERLSTPDQDYSGEPPKIAEMIGSNLHNIKDITKMSRGTIIRYIFNSRN
jgi:hypothetical protein